MHVPRQRPHDLLRGGVRILRGQTGRAAHGVSPATAVDGLARLCFSTDDSHGNFTLDRAIGDLPDYRALADLILTALFVGYGARAAMDLEIKAHFALLPRSTCDALG